MTPGTAIDRGLDAARQILTGPNRRPEATPVVVLLTDGRPTTGTEGAVLRVYVTTVPEGGKANAAVLKLLAKALGVPKSRLRIVQGETGRDKVVEIG